jgi:transcriptional regulator with XRE-family HTH domain
MPEYISSEIARLLKEEREKRNISLNLLAQKAGVNRQSVAFIEQGLRNPTLNTLFRLTLALEVEPEDIIGRARKLAAKKHPKWFFRDANSADQRGEAGFWTLGRRPVSPRPPVQPKSCDVLRV